MGKTTGLVTVILMTLGLTACSINAGGGSAGEPAPRKPLTDSSPKNSSGNVADNASDGSTNTQSGGNSGDNSTGNANNRANNNETKSGILTNSPTGYITPSSQAYKYLTEESAKQQLLSKISTMNNLTGPCTSARGSSCGSSVPTGTIIAAYKQSYSNYAVVRETYNAGERVKPVNSFISLVTQVTPETNKAAALNATYKGQASYSRNNTPNILTRNDLTLTTTDSTIQGVLNAEANSKGEIYPVITFNAGQITASDKGVTFNGNAVFHSRFNSGATAGNAQDLPLTYQGFFAGPNAEEVIGTFETGSYTDTKSVQGAFAGKKQ